eukprot:scaffold234175_cov57-Attheya_sp.AAC.1
MGTPVTIKDPKAVEKSMISGHFNPVEAWCSRASKRGHYSAQYCLREFLVEVFESRLEESTILYP